MRTNDNGVERDMTEAEEAAYEAWSIIAHAEAEARSEAEAAKVAARQAVLNKLGLSAEEAAALLG
jgi:F0F1-type ATP synthase membrane subunit b/b'